MQHERQEVEAGVSEVLVNLQFQDRVHQILDQVLTDMERMSAAAQTLNANPGSPAPNAQDWLATLSRSYTMHEQRQPGKTRWARRMPDRPRRPAAALRSFSSFESAACRLTCAIVLPSSAVKQEEAPFNSSLNTGCHCRRAKHF